MGYYKIDDNIIKSANRLNKIIKEQNQLMQGRKIDYKNNTVTLQNGEKISLDEYNNKVNSATKRLQKELDIQRKLGYNTAYYRTTKIPDYDITSDVDAYLKLLDYKKGE